jgi:hypothetical protein
VYLLATPYIEISQYPCIQTIIVGWAGWEKKKKRRQGA